MSCTFFSEVMNTYFSVIIWSSYRRMLVVCMTLMDKERFYYFLTKELAVKIANLPLIKIQNLFMLCS